MRSVVSIGPDDIRLSEGLRFHALTLSEDSPLILEKQKLISYTNICGFQINAFIIIIIGFHEVLAC